MTTDHLILLDQSRPTAGKAYTGSLGQDTVFWCFQPTKLWKPTINLKNHGNQPTTMKNHGHQPKTIKDQETTLKNHGNQPKTMKPP